MRGLSALMIAASAATIMGCGSSRNLAPVVYGTQPDSTGRIYNSPADYDRQNGAHTASAPMRPVYASAPVQLAPLAPVSAAALPPAQIYAAGYEVADPAAGNFETAVVTSAPESGLVSVQPGDTVYAISRRTGASPGAIIAENSLRPPYSLEIGQTLRIPSPTQKIANFNAAPAAPAPTLASAPVAAPVAQDRVHLVRPGDTLYSISRSTGASVPVIAQANRLTPPYTLKVGEEILIPGGPGKARAGQREVKAIMPAPRERVEDLAREVSYAPPPTTGRPKLFEWPVKGAVIGKYGAGSLGRRNDGVNIAAPVGTPVRAAADGEVVYRGSELDGYGNLLLVKHGDNYVTAYAHNDVMLVKKGEKVLQGQVIAKVGQTGAATEPQLHFEIRKNLKSVDPETVLGQ